MQSWFVVQPDVHAPPAPQKYGLQDADVAAWQTPAPSHCAAGVNVEPVHEGAEHAVPAG